MATTYTTLDKSLAGIIGTLLLLVGFGGNALISEDLIDKAYVCTINENLGIFDRLSPTMKSGYYIDQFGDEKRKVCTNGFWVPLKQYAKDKGIDPMTFLKQNTAAEPANYMVPNSASVYKCSPKECVRIQ